MADANNRSLSCIVHIHLQVTHKDNKIKNKEYHTVGTIPKSNIKIVERGKIDTLNTLR